MLYALKRKTAICKLGSNLEAYLHISSIHLSVAIFWFVSFVMTSCMSTSMYKYVRKFKYEELYCMFRPSHYHKNIAMYITPTRFAYGNYANKYECSLLVNKSWEDVLLACANRLWCVVFVCRFWLDYHLRMQTKKNHYFPFTVCKWRNTNVMCFELFYIAYLYVIVFYSFRLNVEVRACEPRRLP